MINNLLKNKYFAYFGALICVAFWGTAFPLIKLGYIKLNIASADIASKLLFAGERFALAGIIVFVFGLFYYRKPVLLSKKDLAPVFLLGAVQTFSQYLFAYVGVGFTTAANTSVTTGTVSIISVVLAAVFFKNDKLGAMKITGCVLGLVGIVCVNLADLSLNPLTFIGDIIVLFSAFSGAFGNIITKKISRDKNPTAVTAYQLFFGGVLLIVTGLLFGGRTKFNGAAVVILIWLSIVSSVSFLLWTALLKYHPVSRITIFTMLVPVFGTVWSFILLGENILRIENLISLALIAAGIVLVNIKVNDNEN